MIIFHGLRVSVFAKRLKEARLQAGLSQERLGIEAGLDPMSASTRMNRYELGKRSPHPDLVKGFAKVLTVPPAYFYCEDDVLARVIVAVGRLPSRDRARILNRIESGDF